jgi:hypothetical protein
MPGAGVGTEGFGWTRLSFVAASAKRHPEVERETGLEPATFSLEGLSVLAQ